MQIDSGTAQVLPCPEIQRLAAQTRGIICVPSIIFVAVHILDACHVGSSLHFQRRYMERWRYILSSCEWQLPGPKPLSRKVRKKATVDAISFSSVASICETLCL